MTKPGHSGSKSALIATGLGQGKRAQPSSIRPAAMDPVQLISSLAAVLGRDRRESVTGRLQQERIAAFMEYAGDVATWAVPDAGHITGVDPSELAAFRSLLAPRE